MALPIEQYALLGDCRGSALVGLDGSIDWLCLPRFDSEACFAALLGTQDNGFWRISPIGEITGVRRAYRNGSLTLETELTTAEGTILLTDFMPVGADGPGLVRIVTGVRGSVRVRSELAFRFNYGKTIPWVTRKDGAVEAIAGPDLMKLWAGVELRGENMRTLSDFVVNAGERIPFVLRYGESFATTPLPPLDPDAALAHADQVWFEWSARAQVTGPYGELIKRSLLTVKALTYAPTGGIVAAATTSIPELIGGMRNWDYRYCWLRDSTFALYAFMSAGYHEEARAWRDWLLRAAAGSPDQLQILYGIGGERRLTEVELPWLPGYENSQPVRIGNLAADQLQLDVYGELAATLYLARTGGMSENPNGWAMAQKFREHLAKVWREPDHGIWEVRGPRRHFVHSKVMCWVAFDRAVKSAEKWSLHGPLDEWRRIRDEIHADVCTNGINPETGGFAQYYGSTEPDASLLLLVITGFLPPTDPRIVHTVMDVEKRLLRNGFVDRYLTHPDVDGLPRGEGAFLSCSFWYVDALTMLGRHEEAAAHFDRLAKLVNDVGLLSEEYDPVHKRMLGNFPQVLSHVALIHSAVNLGQWRREG